MGTQVRIAGLLKPAETAAVAKVHKGFQVKSETPVIMFEIDHGFINSYCMGTLFIV